MCKGSIHSLLQAVEAYSRAIEQDDRLLSAYSNRAMAWLRLGDSDQALRDASHALTIDPTNVKALLRRATARSSSSTAAPSFLESVVPCRSRGSVCWSPSRRSLLVLLPTPRHELWCQCRENVGQSDAALADYREALQLESHNRVAASKIEELEKAENLQPS